MFQVNLTSENTDLQHVRELRTSNAEDANLETILTMMRRVFDTRKTAEEKQKEIEDPVESHHIDKYEELREVNEQVFIDIGNLFLFVTGDESVSHETAKDSQERLRKRGHVIEIPITAENEELLQVGF